MRVSSIAKKYYNFHGKQSRKCKEIDLHIPEALLKLGRAVAIEYECSKLHGGGDGKKYTYRHVFETPVDLCMDEKCEQQLYLIGKKLKVTKAGIEN